MKTSIYYFSGTGNSLAVAKELAKELGESTLYPISKVMRAVKGSDKSFSTKADRIVIVTPVYMAGLPRIVAEFARKLKAEGEKKIYGIATHGGMPGRVLHQLDEILRKNETRLSGGFLVNLPGNCITLYSAFGRNKQDSLFRVARLRIKDMAKVIIEGSEQKIEESHALLNRLLSGPIYRAAIKHFRDNDREFYVTDKCNGCELCMEICPVENIKMIEGRPEWQHNCEQCMACIQWCPLEAIQHGEKTIKRKRYRHPDVKADELIR